MPPDQLPPNAVPDARRLLREARAATLATTIAGQPFTSLVTPATAPDLSVLLLLSTLSEHTRHLMADPRCALMAVGAPEDANPQTAPRLSVTGLAERIDDDALKTRWLAWHPYAALYAGFADFALWRIRPQAGLLVSGFARATRLKAAHLLPDAAAVAAIAAAEADIIAHCNADHADAMATLAGGVPGDSWKLVMVDVDGCVLAHHDQTRRIMFDRPARTAEDVRAALIRLIKEK